MSTVRTALHRFGLAAVATLSAVVIALSLSSPAAAEPSKEELRAKLDKAGKELSAVVEKYNDAREKLKSIKARVAKLNKQLAPMQRRVDALYEETGKLAAAAYKGGHASAVDAMLDSGSPQTLVDQMSTLDVIAAKQNKQIRKLNLAKADLDAKKADIDKLLDKQNKLAKDLAAKKKQIETDIAKLEATYEKAFGPLDPPEQDYGAPPYVGGKAQVVVNYAYDQLGKPYGYGEAGPSRFDCSGLTLAAYRQIGVSLPHSSKQQYYNTGRLSRSELRPGDLVFFYSDLHHVGIYIGNNTLIHSPQPGEYVEKISIDAMPYAGAGRPSY